MIEIVGTPATTLGYADGQLKGYALVTFRGSVLANFCVTYDFKTGELIDLQEQNLEENSNFLQTIAYDSEEQTFYGYGRIDGLIAFGKAPVDDPFNYTMINEQEAEESCISLTYNFIDNNIYGVNGNYDFVKINKIDGSQEVLMHLDVPDGGQYITGLAYDATADVYYWNINLKDNSSAIATIDLNNKRLDIYDELEYAEQFVSLFSTDTTIIPDQPRRPKAEGANFFKNSASGTVTYVLPTELNNGTKIEGNVKYNAYLDGQFYSSGSKEAGATVKINYLVKNTDAMHSFGLSAIVNGVESTIATVTTYVGNDTPAASTDVVLTSTEVSWSPVTEGIHGGYIDTKAMTYTVYLNGEEAGTTSDTSFALNIDKDAELKYYKAEVVAVCNGLSSVGSDSNGITEGSALKLPQYLAPTADEFRLFTVIDNNGDEKGWSYNNNSVVTTYSEPGTQMDDWLFLPKMQFNDPDKFYTFSFEVALRNAKFSNEYYEVLLCNEPNTQSVVETIINETMPESADYETESRTFRVHQPGVYYIAIHCTSDPDQFGIIARNFSVEDNNITIASPEAVTNLSAEPVVPGSTELIASFTMPVKTLGDTEISADTNLKATIKCNDVTTIVTGHPGEFIEKSIEGITGMNTVSVVISDGEFNSPAATYIVKGGYDVPSTVAGVSAEVSEDMMSATLTWAPVTTGWISEEDPTGGVIDPEAVTYDIFLYNGYEWDLYETGITDTEYVYEADDQDYVRLGVCACNESGDNGWLSTVAVVVGKPYALPMVEDFDEGGFNTQPWITSDTSDVAPEVYLYYTNRVSDKYEDLNTVSLVVYGDEGAAGSLGTPKFSTKGTDKVTLTLEVSGDFDLPKTTIYADAYGIEETAIGEIKCENAGFNKISVELPAEFIGKDWVGLYIGYEFASADEMLVIESITIDNGSSVKTIDMNNGVKIAGGKNRIKVSGLNGQEVTISTLDGRVAAKSAKVVNDAVFNVEKGIYVVKAGNKNAKVVVK